MGATLRKNTCFLILFIEIAGFIISISLYFLLKNKILGPVYTDSNMLHFFFIASIVFGISFIDIPVVAKAMFRAMDETDYDEFGLNKKKNQHMMSRQQREKIEADKIADMERVISRETLQRLIKKGSDNPDEDLKKLTGLNQVKQKVSELEAVMEFNAAGHKKCKDMQGYHMVFTGPPGTGKTVIARIMTGILWDYGIIKENKIVEVDGNFLKSTTPADSATKTKVLIRAAYGGVLFIDEAYALCMDKYGLSAIATLIKEMEDHRDAFVLIMAGYTEEMEELLSQNPGFRSRIRDRIDFGNYTKQELISIFLNMAREKGFETDDSCIQCLSRKLEQERKLPSWGNARTVRKILDEVVSFHAVRFMQGEINKKNRYVLDAGDFR